MKYLINLLILTLAFTSCRKFDWNNPSDTVNAGKEPASLKNGLVAYYPFNGNANDESGNGNNGVNNGASLSIDRTEKPNRAFDFDGKSYITTPISLISGSLSLVVWFKSNKAVIGTPGLISSRNGHNRLTGISFIELNNIFFEVVSGADNRNSIQMLNPHDNKWHNIIAIYSEDSTFLYYDGALKNKRKINHNEPIISAPIYFGLDNLLVQENRYWVGKLDDIRIYNRALTQEEITYLANH
jgi:hypothetical protein